MNDVTARGPLVLVVEDELLIATTLEMALEDEGYRVLGPAADIDAALELLQRDRPDVALIDYRLGHSTTEALLPELDARRIPACVVTGYGAAQLPVAYTGYTVIEKPFAMPDLMAALMRMVPVKS